jgi:hypothetical protein
MRGEKLMVNSSVGAMMIILNDYPLNVSEIRFLEVELPIFSGLDEANMDAGKL